jgi:hypothetical protein
MAITLAFASILLASCATLTPREGAIAMDAFHIADIAGTAVASVYGGSVAGQLASDGLSALGSVLQGYVDSKIPSDIVAATPGIEGLGSAALGIVDSSKIV